MQIKKAMDSLIQTFDKTEKSKSSESKSKEQVGIAGAKSLFENCAAIGTAPVSVAGSVANAAMSAVKASAAIATTAVAVGVTTTAVAVAAGQTAGTAAVDVGVLTATVGAGVAVGQAVGTAAVAVGVSAAIVAVGAGQAAGTAAKSEAEAGEGKVGAASSQMESLAQDLDALNKRVRSEDSDAKRESVKLLESREEQSKELLKSDQ